MQSDYLPILLQVLIAIGFACGALLVSVILGKATRRNATKDTAYECGMIAEGEVQPRFSVKFYLVAMLFILFDLEIVFMYPWAVNFKELGVFGLIEMFSFMALMIVGLVYIIRRGALKWE